MPEKSAWTAIIEAVTNPLGFFTLALLMVEALIAALSLTGSPQLLILSILTASMFVMVVGVVVWLVANYPEALLAKTPADLRKRVDLTE